MEEEVEDSSDVEVSVRGIWASKVPLEFVPSLQYALVELV